MAALEPDEVVLGGGNVKKLKKLPPGCRAGENGNAFLGGFRLWEQTAGRPTRSRTELSRVNQNMSRRDAGKQTEKEYV